MADTTPVYGLPFLEVNDPPDLASDGQDSMLAVEDELQRIDAAIATLNGLTNVVAADSNTEGPYSSTTFTAGTNVCGVAFTAPASGSVVVFWKAYFQSAINDKAALVSMEVRSGATIGGGSVVVAANSNDAIGVSGSVTTGVEAKTNAGTWRLVTSLTAGNSYHVRVMHQTESGGNITLFYRSIMVQPQL